MSDYSASPVPKIKSAVGALSASAAEGVQLQTPAAASRLNQPANAAASSASPANSFDSVYSQAPAQTATTAVKFVEDPETKAVTVFVIDRATHQVVRTIPQDEMNSMQPGSLLEINA